MFYKILLKDHVRVPPSLFSLSLDEAITQQIRKSYDGYISKDFGIVIGVAKIKEVSEGVIIPGDGAPYYETEFWLYSFNPEVHEVLFGKIKDIADFGAFINLGPIDGMIHISQTMDDFVSFNQDKVLVGKETKHVLRIGDKCKARMIAVSFKDTLTPKLGLTMRQPGLGKIEWLEEEKAATAKKEPKAEEK